MRPRVIASCSCSTEASTTSNAGLGFLFGAAAAVMATAAARRSASPRTASGAVRHHEVAHAVDVALELVARLDRPHARRRAGEDEVAGLQRDEVREVVDLLGHAPD